ncbi:hypothetical protein V1358_10655 [Pseudoalteromonas sp. YIC-656]
MKYTLIFLFGLFAFTGLIASQHMFANAPSTADQYTLTIQVDSSQCTHQDSDTEDEPDTCFASNLKTHTHNYNDATQTPVEVLSHQVITSAQQRAPPIFS